MYEKSYMMMIIIVLIIIYIHQLHSAYVLHILKRVHISLLGV